MQADSIEKAHENPNMSALPALRERGIRYDNVLELKCDCERLGWNLEYHQIDPGQFKAVVAANRVGEISLAIKQLNLRAEVLGTSPQDHVTIVSPDCGQTIWANGFRLEDSDALVLRPDARMHIVGGPTIVAIVHVPLRLLGKVGMSESEFQSVDSRDGTLVVNTVGAAESLRWLTSTSIYMSGHAASRESRLAAATGNVIRQAIVQQRDRSRRSEAWRTISRAREYIEANLNERIRMNEVSDYAAASISKLERTFQSELCMTPSRYILARRLHAVKLDLRTAISKEAKVSDLAMQYGFRHLGRFAAAYCDQFGELPSETLQAQAG